MGGCSPWIARLYGRQPLLGATVTGLTAAAAASMSRESASTIIVLSLAGYLILSLLENRWRLLFLSSAVAAHITAVVLYYTNPIPLPLVLLERSSNGLVANLDIVQIVILAEAATALSTPPSSLPCRVEEEETLEAGEEGTHPENVEGKGENRELEKQDYPTQAGK